MPVEFSIQGNELQILISQTAFGLAPGTTKTTVEFKWADNLQQPSDILYFYMSNEVAPEGCFNWRFNDR